jgi:methyl-accepting chemotaxis protein
MIMAIFQRRRYFIDKQLQTKYVILTILLLLIYTFLFVVILIFPYVVPLAFDYPVEEQAKAARMLLTLHKSIWPALGAVMLIMGTASIFITHKIAGPVYRFKQVLAEIYSGNLNVSIKLRNRDDLKDLAEEFNKVISELRGVVETLQGGHETISSCIVELEDQVKNNPISDETRQALIQKMQTSKQSIAEVLDKYSRQ